LAPWPAAHPEVPPTAAIQSITKRGDQQTLPAGGLFSLKSRIVVMTGDTAVKALYMNKTYERHRSEGEIAVKFVCQILD
jgi:hypothetical protein